MSAALVRKPEVTRLSRDNIVATVVQEGEGVFYSHPSSAKTRIVVGFIYLFYSVYT